MRLLVAKCKAWKQATVNQVLKETKYKVGDSMERIGESDKVNPNPVLTDGNVLSITDTDGKVLKFQILKSRPGHGTLDLDCVAIDENAIAEVKFNEKPSLRNTYSASCSGPRP